MVSGEKKSRPWLIGLLCLGIVVLGGYLLRVPLVEWAAKRALASQGFETAQLSVLDVGLTEIQIRELVLGPDVSADEIAVGYTMSSLLSGQVTWISIQSPKLDLSRPDQGAIAVIQSLAGGGTTGGNEVVALPSVNVTNAVLGMALEGRRAIASFSVKLAPDGHIDGAGLIEASLETAAGPVRVEKLTLKFAGNVLQKSGKVDVEQGILKHDAEEPDWTPVSIAGQLEASQTDARFFLKAGLDEEKPLFRAEGQHSFSQGIGKAVFDIQDITFDKAGLQPADISGYLQDIPPVDGILSSHSDLEWDQAMLTARTDMQLKELLLIGEGYSISTSDLSVQVKTEFDMATGDHQIALSSFNQKLRLRHQEQDYTLEGGDIQLTARDYLNYAVLEQLRVTATHENEEPYFIPLVLAMSGKTENGKFAFSGSIQDRQGELSLPFNGITDRASFETSADIRFFHKGFAEGGLQPGKFSTFLKDLPGTISGNVEADLNLAWHPEQGVTVRNLAARLRQFGYRDTSIRLSALDADILSEEISLNKRFKTKIIDSTFFVEAEKQSFSVKGLSADIDVQDGWEKAKIDLKKLGLVPSKSAILAKAVSLSGTSEASLNDITFDLSVSHDFLGSFLRLEGKHSLASLQGKADIRSMPIIFEKDGVQPGDIVRLSDKKLQVSGTAKGAASLNWSSKGLKASADLSFDDLDVETEEIKIIGASGQVRADELFPLTISSSQEIRAETISTAVGISRPSARFRIKNRKGYPVLFLDRLEAGIVGGTALVEKAEVDTGKDENSVIVNLSNLDLERLMDISGVEDFTASGTLNGYLPLKFDGELLTIDTGILETAGPGLLQLKSEKARQALSGGGSQTKLLFDILENFQYSELAMRIRKKESGEDTVTLKTKGSNPDVENNRAVVLNINLETNLDRILNTILDGYLLSEKALRATVRKRAN